MAIFTSINNTPCNLSSHALFLSIKQQRSKEFHPWRILMQRAPIRLRKTLAIASSSSSSSISSPVMTLYDVLCVSQSAELDDVKKAYREKVRVYHPDVCPPGVREESCKMFLLVQEAYETLSDPILRVDYDLNLHFNPHLMHMQRRDEREMSKQEWGEQLQSLNRSRTKARDTWGGRMRRHREAAAAAVHEIL